MVWRTVCRVVLPKDLALLGLRPGKDLSNMGVELEASTGPAGQDIVHAREMVREILEKSRVGIPHSLVAQG